jgi:hypothetical protein
MDSMHLGHSTVLRGKLSTIAFLNVLSYAFSYRFKEVFFQSCRICKTSFSDLAAPQGYTFSRRPESLFDEDVIKGFQLVVL